MLAGEPPFTGPTAQAVIAKRFTETVPLHPARSARAVPASWTAIVLRALAPAPADRFPSAAAFAAALRAGRAVDPPGHRAAGVVPRRRAIGRGAALRQPERRPGERVLRRRHDRGADQRAGQGAGPARGVAHLLLRLQGTAEDVREIGAPAPGSHRARGERAPGRQAAPGRRPSSSTSPTAFSCGPRASTARSRTSSRSRTRSPGRSAARSGSGCSTPARESLVKPPTATSRPTGSTSRAATSGTAAPSRISAGAWSTSSRPLRGTRDSRWRTPAWRTPGCCWASTRRCRRGRCSPAPSAPRTRRCALEPGLAEAHPSLASRRCTTTGIGRRRSGRSAARSSCTPGYATAHQWYGNFLSVQGGPRSASASSSGR